MIESKSHELRGHMVTRRTQHEIAIKALERFVSIPPNLINPPNIEHLIDYLSLQDIDVHIVSNKSWDKRHTKLKKGESIPQQNLIQVPKRLIDGANKKAIDDWHTFFHEVGHVMLEHKPIYLKTDIGYVIEPLDDAEEQADYFAKIMMGLFGLKVEPKQLELF